MSEKERLRELESMLRAAEDGCQKLAEERDEAREIAIQAVYALLKTGGENAVRALEMGPYPATMPAWVKVALTELNQP